tara:strand:+ start:2098 stop:2619 length:522 start_codon:yes stop_codon:yes gene_type:complete
MDTYIDEEDILDDITSIIGVCTKNTTKETIKNKFIESIVENVENTGDSITDYIIDSSNDIFNELGKGFNECIYHKALLYILCKTEYIIETKKIIPINYKEQNVGYVEADLVLCNKDTMYIIELKAFDREISNKEYIQVEKYKKHIVTDKEIKWIIINFNQKNNKKYVVDYKIG